jgi:uncharacterized membrane protein
MENKQSENELTVPPPIINDRGLAFAVYVLYLVGYITGITVLIGVVIAYSQATRSARSPIKSHYTFQVRTFWIGLIYLVVGFFSSTFWCWSADPVVVGCVVARTKRKRIIDAQSQRTDREPRVVDVW